MSSLTPYRPAVTFQTQDLASFTRLRRYLESAGKQEVREITKHANNLQPRLLNRRWSVDWIITPFHWVTTHFFYCIGTFCYYLGASSLYKRCKVLCDHHKKSVFEEAPKGFPLLAKSRNMHRLNDADFFLKSSIPIQSLPDRQVIDMTFAPKIEDLPRCLKLKRFFAKHPHWRTHPSIKKDEDAFRKLELSERIVTKDSAWNLSFFWDGGICRGMSNWFLYLYFKTLAKFKNRLVHIAAVGKMFENGATPPAVLLQMFDNTALENALNIKSTQVCKISHRDLNLYEAKKHKGHILEKIVALPPGAYGVWLHQHRVNYIKISHECGVIFDPNLGCIPFLQQKDGEGQADQVLNYLSTYHESNQPSSNIEFHRFEQNFVAG